jgi:hypothetical protein
MPGLGITAMIGPGTVGPASDNPVGGDRLLRNR